MLLGTTFDYKICIEINGDTVNLLDNVKLLRITIDSGLEFEQNVRGPVAKLNKVVNASSGVTKL